MKMHFNFFLILIISSVFALIGFIESKKNNNNLYIKINPKINNVNIIPHIQQRMNGRIGSVRIYTNNTIYNVHANYIYQVKGIPYFYSYKYITVNDSNTAYNYINKIKREKPSIQLYYLKSNPKVTVLSIKKNNFIIFYILSGICLIISILCIKQKYIQKSNIYL